MKNICFYLYLATPEIPAEQPGIRMGEGVDLRQVTVLSKGDWERIQSQLHRKQIDEDRERRKQAEIDEKKKKSKEMVDTWGNTIIVSIEFGCHGHVTDLITKHDHILCPLSLLTIVKNGAYHLARFFIIFHNTINLLSQKFIQIKKKN